MKKALLVIGAVLIVVIGLGITFRDTVQFVLMAITLQPDVGFDETTPPTPPDYDNPDHWAALPNRKDQADVVPVGAYPDNQADAQVDVFFIHPTTYLTSDSWNQPLDHKTTNTMTDEFVLRNQASVFNGCCKIYAPRYRQATLYSFFDQEGGGSAAIDLAYQDVLSAFHYYLTHYNQDRPFIIAGHSQGSTHSDKLLREEIAGTELQQRLVAAYPIGYFLDGSNGIPVCNSPTQTGCQVTRNTVGMAAAQFRDTASDICVNPLSWQTDGARASHELNLGAVAHEVAGQPEPGVTDAQCIDGRLIVTEIRSENYSNMMMGPDNYHIYDYSLFHLNIRKNVEARVAAYLANDPSS
ncbi:MAG: DUF3089 domain-containing protein [Gammaproteobacteria bacterium]|nr:DUF3089 domain-containing protein [Gammaproteobacteria bacterium]